MILVVDNYDSFTFNLVQAFQSLGAEVEVHRNDEISVADVRAMTPEAVVLSPGPCTPAEAGISVPLIQALSGKVPILGVCLGHQSIGAAFGGVVRRAGRVVHGKTSPVSHQGRGLFSGLPRPLPVGRYHSLVVERSTLPEVLEVTAVSTDDGEVMALRHRTHPTVGVQFHPESVLTPDGPALLRNFLEGRLGP
ncbi:MAG TPA: aminodeoxychorismate/anthranilate synthase component II [Myxococcaceae bacterium]|nr:aminodeoxychorismate/anthranilate synthase component II [Myxococcaceae bacterium]